MNRIPYNGDLHKLKDIFYLQRYATAIILLKEVNLPKNILHVLIIEDDPLQLRLIKKRFALFSSRYTLFFAGSLSEAKEILNEKTIDVIVSDIFLPDGKGIDLLYAYNDLPIILMTGQGSVTTAIQGLKAGAADYVLKDSEQFTHLPKLIDDAVAAWDAAAEPKSLSRLHSHMPTMLDTMLDGVVVTDLNGEIVYANKSAENILELQRDGIIGTFYFDKKWQNIDEDGNILEEKQLPLYLALKMQRNVSNMEHGLTLPDSREFRWLSVNAVPMYDGGKSLIGAIASFRDISAKRELEQEIQRGQRLISAIEYASETLLVLLDYEGRIIRFNRACEELTGHTSEEVQGKVFWDYLVPEEEQEKVLRMFLELRDENKSNKFQNYLIGKNGEKRFVAWSNTIVRDGKGNFEYVLKTGVDISERKEEEERRLEEMKNELTALEQFAFKNTTTVTSGSYGQKPLKEQSPETFYDSVKAFSGILDAKIEELTFKVKTKYVEDLELLADTLGIVKVKPKDVIDIYTKVLQKKLQDHTPAKNKVYREEGRLLVLELMGYLVTFYRKYYTGTLREES